MKERRKAVDMEKLSIELEQKLDKVTLEKVVGSIKRNVMYMYMYMYRTVAVAVTVYSQSVCVCLRCGID